MKIGNDNEILPSGITLRVQIDSTGNIVHIKAILVVLGNLKPDALNYIELYAPAVCNSFVCSMLAVSISRRRYVYRLNS